jgi:hypothetical protein
LRDDSSCCCGGCLGGQWGPSHVPKMEPLTASQRLTREAIVQVKAVNDAQHRQLCDSQGAYRLMSSSKTASLLCKSSDMSQLRTADLDPGDAGWSTSLNICHCP